MSCPSAFRSALASLAIAAGALASAAGQELVRDFNTTPSSEAGSSHPHSFVALPGGELLLGLRTPRFGDELWRTDGTAAGTRLVADLQPGPGGSQFLQMTELYSGADLVELANRTAERAPERSLETGKVHRVEPKDLERAIAATRASTLAWLAMDRNYARYSHAGGQTVRAVAYLYRAQ